MNDYEKEINKQKRDNKENELPVKGKVTTPDKANTFERDINNI
jgi:hypothetical protein